MDYKSMISNLPTSVLIIACIVVVALSLFFLRTMAKSEHNKMLEAKKEALENPAKIEKIKLVDHREIYCVVTMKGKGPDIIAQGVEAVRLYDQLLISNPELAK